MNDPRTLESLKRLLTELTMSFRSQMKLVLEVKARLVEREGERAVSRRSVHNRGRDEIDRPLWEEDRVVERRRQVVLIVGDVGGDWHACAASPTSIVWPSGSFEVTERTHLR
jgi:hypothetical protein